MILEGIVTSLAADGSVNIAPMGAAVQQEMTRLVLRPYRTASTYENLKRHGEGVFHVTDDVWLLAVTAVSRPAPMPPMFPAERVAGQVLADACRWYEFRVTRLDDRTERTTIECDVVHRGWRRDFVGFNRAKHAVLEAAILATRVAFLPAEQRAAELVRLEPLVQKTGDEPERRAFDFLRKYVTSWTPPKS